MRKLNKIIYEQFLDHRSNNKIITDQILRLWAIKQRNLLGNEVAEKFVVENVVIYNNFKRRFNILSRNITYKVGKIFYKI